MAKHQLRKMKEPKKPKKPKQAVVTSTETAPFISPAKPGMGHKTCH